MLASNDQIYSLENLDPAKRLLMICLHMRNVDGFVSLRSGQQRNH